ANSQFAIGAATSNGYDKLGRLRVSYDEFDGGNRTYFVYDNAGRKTAEIDDYGFLTEFIYAADNRLIATAQYANNLPASYLTALQDPNNTWTIAQLRPPAHGQDLHEWTVYDAGGRVVQRIDGTGAVTAYEYDGMSRVVRTTVYGTRVSVSGFAGT